MDLQEVQKYFSFAWEHTVYRANLVALREALGLRDQVSLPVDQSLPALLKEMRIPGPLTTDYSYGGVGEHEGGDAEIPNGWQKGQ